MAEELRVAYCGRAVSGATVDADSIISSGGSCVNNLLASGSCTALPSAYVFSGNVISGAELHLQSGAIWTSSWVSSNTPTGGGYVSSGGFAADLLVLQGGSLRILSGGTGSGVYLLNSGSLFVDSGGTLYQSTLPGITATPSINSGATVINLDPDLVTVINSGAVTSKGDTVSGATVVKPDGSIIVSGISKLLVEFDRKRISAGVVVKDPLMINLKELPTKGYAINPEHIPVYDFTVSSSIEVGGTTAAFNGLRFYSELDGGVIQWVYNSNTQPNVEIQCSDVYQYWDIPVITSSVVSGANAGTAYYCSTIHSSRLVSGGMAYSDDSGAHWSNFDPASGANIMWCYDSGGAIVSGTGYCNSVINSGGVASDILLNGYMRLNHGGSVYLAFNPWQRAASIDADVPYSTLPRDYSLYLGGDAHGCISRLSALSYAAIPAGSSAVVYPGGILASSVISRYEEYPDHRISVLQVSGGYAVNIRVQGTFETCSEDSVPGSADSIFLASSASGTISESSYVSNLYMNGGEITVYSGGTVSIAYNPWASNHYVMVPSNEAVDNYVIISGGTVLYDTKVYPVYSGHRDRGTLAVMSETRFDSLEDGYGLYIYSGGIANSITGSAGRTSITMSGGVVNAVFVSGGTLLVDALAGNANLLSFTESVGRAEVLFHGNAIGSAWNLGTPPPESSAIDTGYESYTYHQATIYDSATLTGVILDRHGALVVDGAALVQGAVAQVWGRVAVSGGVVSDIIVGNYGSGAVLSGGFMSTITISHGLLRVSSGGIAKDITWTPGDGAFDRTPTGATFTFTSDYSGVYIGSSGTFIRNIDSVVSEVNLSYRDYYYIMSGGLVSGIELVENESNWLPPAAVFVWSGGTITNTSIGGSRYVSYGNDGSITAWTSGSALFMDYYTPAELLVYSGGTATDITFGRGVAIAYSGALLSGFTLNSGYSESEGDTPGYTGGHLFISSGLTGYNVTVNAGNYNVTPYTVATSTYISGGGVTYIANGGSYIDSGSNGGNARVYESAIMNCVHVSGGTLFAYPGATVNELYEAGGYVDVWSDTDIEFMPVHISGSSIYYNSAGTGTVSGIMAPFYNRGMTIHSSTYVEDISGGQALLRIYDSAAARKLYLQKGNSIYIYSGGELTDLILSAASGPTEIAISGGYLADAQITGGVRSAWKASGSTYGFTPVSVTIYGGSCANIDLKDGIKYMASAGETSDVFTHPWTYVSFGGGSAVVHERGGYVDTGDFVESVMFSSSIFSSIALADKCTIHSNTSGKALVIGANPLPVTSYWSPDDDESIIPKYAYISGAVLYTSGDYSYYSGGIALQLTSPTVGSGGGVWLSSAGGSAFVPFEPEIHYSEDSPVVDESTQYGLSGGLYSGGSLVFGHWYTKEVPISNGSANLKQVVSVYSGGQLEDIRVHSSGYLYIGSGAHVSSVWESGGFISAYPPESISGALITPSIMSGMWASNTEYSASVNSGNSIIDLTLEAGSVWAFYSGFISGASVVSNGKLFVSGGSCRDLYISGNSSTTSVYIGSGGYVSSAVVKDGAYFYVASGGTLYMSTDPWMTGIQVESGADVHVEGLSGAYFGSDALTWQATSSSGVIVNYNEKLYVYSGGTIDEALINRGGFLLVSGGSVVSGGRVSLQFNPWPGTIISGEGAILNQLPRSNSVYYGGGFSGTTIISSGVPEDVDVPVGIISAADLLSGLTTSKQNEIIVYSGGTLLSCNINRTSGYISGGLVSGDTVNGFIKLSDEPQSGSAYYHQSGAMYINSGAHVSGLVASSAAWVNVSSGAELSGCSVTGKYAVYWLSGGAICSDLCCESGGCFIVSSGATIGGAVISSGGTMAMYNYGAAGVSGITLSSGGLLYVPDKATITAVELAGGAINGIGVDGLTGTIDINGEPTYPGSGAVLSGGTIFIKPGATMNSVTVYPPITTYDLTRVPIHVGDEDFDGTIDFLTQTPEAIVASGAVVSNLRLNGSAILSSAGVINLTTIGSHGNLIVLSGAVVSSATLNAGGVAHVSGSILQATENLGAVFISGGTVVFQPNVIYLYDVQSQSSDNVFTVHSGTTLYEGPLTGTGYIYSAGVVGNVSLTNAAVTLYSGGRADIVNINHAAEFIVSGGLLSNAYVYESGALILSSGSAYDINNMTSGSLRVYGNPRVDSVYTIYDTIIAGGIVSNVDIGDGTTIVSAGASVYSMSIFSNGTCLISSGGFVSGVVLPAVESYEHPLLSVGAGGTAYMVNFTNNLSAFSMDDTAIVTGVPFSSEAVTVGAGDTVWLLGNQTITSITVSRLGTVNMRGGTATEIIVSGGYATFAAGGSVGSLAIESLGSAVLRGRASVDSISVASECELSLNGGYAKTPTHLSGATLKVVSSGIVISSQTASGGGPVGVGTHTVPAGTVAEVIITSGGMMLPTYIISGISSETATGDIIEIPGTIIVNA